MFNAIHGRSVLVVNIGTSGAGKSFVSGTVLPDAVVLNCDSIKENATEGARPTKSFPEGAGCSWPSESDFASRKDYSEACSKAASVLHRWSKEVLAEDTPATISARPDVVLYDSTGTDDAEIDGVIKMAKAEGFKIIALHTDASLETCIGRDESRDRTLGVKIITEKFEWVRNSLTVLRPKVDEFVTINNDEFLAEPSRDAFLAKAERETFEGTKISETVAEGLADFLEAEGEAEYLAEAEADFAEAVFAL